ncbi:MAG: SDR family NAD(P)-dependent oxidoreductase, partial [Flavobacteriales bacterium]
MHPILIIGASRGIGRALAQRLIAQGRSVITLGRTIPDVDGIVDQITHDVLAP